jgi:hypothetical protein
MKLIPHSVTRAVGRQTLVAKKNSPHIFFGGGLIGVLGGAFLACRATLKLEAAVDEIQLDIDSVKEMQQDARDKPDLIDHTEADYYKDLTYVYLKAGLKLGRLYGPALAVGGLGVASLTGSHIQLSKRNTALTVTLASTMKAFDEYRERVEAQLGKERELELHRAVSTEKNDEGKNTKVTDPDAWSPYARFFDENNTNWQKSPEHNWNFLTMVQRHMNGILQHRGHVFLNDVYDALGMERSREGAVVGWLYEHPDPEQSDGFVDFGIFEAVNSKFVAGWERSVILDFNVDGVIYNLI